MKLRSEKLLTAARVTMLAMLTILAALMLKNPIVEWLILPLSLGIVTLITAAVWYSLKGQ